MTNEKKGDGRVAKITCYASFCYVSFSRPAVQNFRIHSKEINDDMKEAV